MDAELTRRLANRAGAALARALVADGWEAAWRAAGEVWRTTPDRAGVEAEFLEVRADLLAAQAARDLPAEQGAVRRCQLRFAALLDSRPELAWRVRELLEEWDPSTRYGMPPLPFGAGRGLDGGPPDVGSVQTGTPPDFDRPPGPEVDEDDEW